MAVKADRMKALAGLLGDDSDIEDDDMFGSIQDRRTMFDAPKTSESSRTPKSLRGRASMGGMHVARRAAEGRPDAVRRNPKGRHSLPSSLGQPHIGSTRSADMTDNQPIVATQKERDYAATKSFEEEGDPAASHRDDDHRVFPGGSVTNSKGDDDDKEGNCEKIVFGRPKTFGAAGGLVTDFEPNVRERASAISHWKLSKKDRDGRARALEWRVDDGWINRNADEDISPGSGGSRGSGGRFGSNGRDRGAPSFLSQFERQSSRDEQDGASANGSHTSRHASAAAVSSSPRFSPSSHAATSPTNFNGYGAKISPKSGGGKAVKVKNNATSPRFSPSSRAVPSPRNFNGYGAKTSPNSGGGKTVKAKKNATSPGDGVNKAAIVHRTPSPQNKPSRSKFMGQGATPSPESKNGKSNEYVGSGTSSSAKTRRVNARPEILTRFLEDIENKHSANGLPSPRSEVPVPPSPRRALSPRNSSSFEGGDALLTPSKIKTPGFLQGNALLSPSKVKMSGLSPGERSAERKQPTSPRWNGGTMLVSPGKIKRSSFPIAKLESKKSNDGGHPSLASPLSSKPPMSPQAEKFNGNAYPNLISSPRGKPPMSPRFTPGGTARKGKSKTPRSGGKTPKTPSSASPFSTNDKQVIASHSSGKTSGSPSWEGPFFSKEYRATNDSKTPSESYIIESYSDGSVPLSQNPFLRNDASRTLNQKRAHGQAQLNEVESRIARAKAPIKDEETDAGCTPPMEEERATRVEPAATSVPIREAQEAPDGSSDKCERASSSSQNAGNSFGKGVEASSAKDTDDKAAPNRLNDDGKSQGSHQAKAQLEKQGKDEKFLPLAKEPLSSSSTEKEKSPNAHSGNCVRTPSAQNVGKGATTSSRQAEAEALAAQAKPQLERWDNRTNEGSQKEETVQTYAPAEEAQLPLSKEGKSSQGDSMQAPFVQNKKKMAVRNQRQARTEAQVAKVKTPGAQARVQMMEHSRAVDAPSEEVKSLHSIEEEKFVDQRKKATMACDEGGTGVRTWMPAVRGAAANQCRAEGKRVAVSAEAKTTVGGGAVNKEDMPVTPARTPRGYAMSMQKGILRPSPSNTPANEGGRVGPFSPVAASAKRSPQEYELSRQNGVLSPSLVPSPAVANGEAMPFMHKIDSSEVEETLTNGEDSSVEDVTPPGQDEARITEEVLRSGGVGDANINSVKNNGRPKPEGTTTPVTEVLEEAMSLLRTPSGRRTQAGSATFDAADSFGGSSGIWDKGAGIGDGKKALTEEDCYDEELKLAKRLALALDRFLVSTDSRGAERFEEWAVGDGRVASDKIKDAECRQFERTTNSGIINSQEESKCFMDDVKVDDLSRSNDVMGHGLSEQFEEDDKGVNKNDQEILSIEIQRLESNMSNDMAWEGWAETPTAYVGGPPVETPTIYAPPPVETPPIETPMNIDGVPAMVDRDRSPLPIKSGCDSPSSGFDNDASFDKPHDASVEDHASFEAFDQCVENHASFETFDQSFDGCGNVAGKDGTNFEIFDQPLDASGFRAFKGGSSNHCQGGGGDAFCPFSLGSPETDHATNPQTGWEGGVPKKNFPKKKSPKKKANLTISTSFANVENKIQKPKIKICIGGAPTFKPPEKKDEEMFYVARQSPSCGDGAHLLNGSLSSSMVSPLASKQEPAIIGMLGANRGKRLLKGFLIGGRQTPPRLYNFSKKDDDENSPYHPTDGADAEISEGQYFATPATPTMESYVQISINSPPKKSAGSAIAEKHNAKVEVSGDRGNVKKAKGLLQRMKGGNARH